ncbi:MAG: NOB1 family endonuclease [Candidatus Geothermarchaeales archaeon]
MRRKEKNYVVDVAGLTLHIRGGSLYTTPQIIGEVRESLREALIRSRVEGRAIIIREAEPKYVKRALAEADKMGDRRVLSEADVSLLALFLEMCDQGEGPVLLTDDYALQNIASSLGLEVQTIVGRKIREIIIWKVYCPLCNKSFSPDFRGDRCPECLTPLTRKAISKR